MSTLSEHCKNLISKDANAVCFIKGGPYNQCINGKILFYNSDQGTVICIDISGLPDNSCNIFGFHIHEGMTCTGNENELPTRREKEAEKATKNKIELEKAKTEREQTDKEINVIIRERKTGTADENSMFKGR